MRKLDWDTIKNLAEQVFEVAACGLLLTASHKVVGCVIEGYIGIAGYGEAVNAIMNSGMYSHDACEATAALKRHEDVEYYKAIIHIAKDSRLYSHDKVDLIKGLSEK